MTFRSVLLGLLFGAFICAVTFFNDMVVRGTNLVGNYMPISVFGALLLLVLVLNPLLGRVRAGSRLAGGELATVIAVALVACCVPGRGLMHYFTTFMMIPHEHVKRDVSWRSNDILSVIPSQMLTAADSDGEGSPRAFVEGLGQDRKHFSVGDIPWRVWERPLVFWLPLILSIWLATGALAVVLHRQWSKHEKLRYPIATFAHALMPGPDGKSSTIFRNRVFWIAAGLVVLIHLNNYASLYYPRLTWIPLSINLIPLADKLMPLLVEGGGRRLMYFEFFLTAVGFAYLLSSDLSLSVGLAPYVWAFVNGIFLTYGVVLDTGLSFMVHPRPFLHAGAYVGLFMMLAYTGRRYYANVFREAVIPRRRRTTSAVAVWAARVFIVALVAFIAQLIAAGLDWPLAVLYTLGAIVIYTVISRIVAETGVFYIHPWFFPGVVLLGFLGLTALDVRSLAIMFMVTSLILVDPREALMPFLVTGLKLVDLNRVHLGRTVGVGAIMLLLAVAVALPVTLYLQYDRGANQTGDGWTLWYVPTKALTDLVAIKAQIESTPDLATAKIPAGLSRFLDMRPDGKAAAAFFIALVLVLAFSAARTRFSWWPIHPVLFAVLGTYQSFSLARSFLLGWLIKVAVVRLFGGRGYEKVKPFMIGVIAGDILGGILPMIHGAVYHMATGANPALFKTLP